MTTVTTYSTKPLAIEAARAALKAAGVKDPMSAVHYTLTQDGEEWAWHEMNVTSGETAVGERIADGAVQGKPVLVTVIPAKGSKPAAVKAKPAPKAKAPAVVGKREAARLAKIAAADAKNKAPKAPKAPRAPKAAKGPSQKQARIDSAMKGVLPTAPDFSAETHKRWRKALQSVVDHAKAGNLKGLKADKTERKSSSRNAICAYRDLCILALEAKAKAAKATMKKAA